MQTQLSQHPRYGFTEQRIIDTNLTNVALTGVAVERRVGMRFAVVVGLYSLTGGGGEVSLIIEGSNTGVNWFELSRTASTELFTTDGQVVVLNAAAGDGQVDLERWEFIRIRAVIVSGAPVFSLHTIVTGIARDSEKFLVPSTLALLGVAPTLVSSANYIRPAGTRFVNLEVVATGVVLGGLANFVFAFQGSPDDGTTYVDIATRNFVGDFVEAFTVDGQRMFDLGQYANLRLQIRHGGGVPGGATSATVNARLSLDSADWTADDESGTSGGVDVTSVFLSAVFDAPTPEVADTRTIGVQLFDGEGAPLNEVRKIELILYDTVDAGDQDLALNAIFSAVITGTGVSALSTNRLTLNTNALGFARVAVTDPAVETAFITAVNARANIVSPHVLVAAGQGILIYV